MRASTLIAILTAALLGCSGSDGGETNTTTGGADIAANATDSASGTADAAGPGQGDATGTIADDGLKRRSPLVREFGPSNSWYVAYDVQGPSVSHQPSLLKSARVSHRFPDSSCDLISLKTTRGSPQRSPCIS